MLKRILFTFLTFMVIYSIILVGYRLNEPEKIELTSELTEYSIPYASLETYTKNSGNSSHHYYFVCSSDSNDCLYMESTVLKSVANDTGLELSRILEYVDMTDSLNKLDTNEMQEKWKISGYPAFIACHVENGNIIVDNTIESSVQFPLSAENVKTWLLQNNLYEDTENTPLDTAIPE